MSSQLATKPEKGGKMAEGFCTPKEDRGPQRMQVPPKRVIPIVFLPGIMGSNLRLRKERQEELKKSNNIAWRPDRKLEALALLRADAATRQLLLDPAATEVDVYAPAGETGCSESADERHSVGRVRQAMTVSLDSPLLFDDPVVYGKQRKSKEQKARERGWGEVYFSSYRKILETCERALNEAVIRGRLSDQVNSLVGAAPSQWRAHRSPNLIPITEAEIKKAVEGCWFPVHAMGYNWLHSNRKSGKSTAVRISSLIERYSSEGYTCEKVIIVTHSMGGLVARALIHPKMGNIANKILGIVHGVMPAIGAPAAYRRMRCGFEESFPALDPAPKILGNHGAEVTAVLGNSVGGLELLPSGAYGNHWLHIAQKDRTILRLPQNGDPYEEIYKLPDKSYGLLKDEWLNPAHLSGRGFHWTCTLLDQAKSFHQEIVGTYHSQSYAHYGADRSRPSWQEVVWRLDDSCAPEHVGDLRISADNQTGRLAVRNPTWPVPVDFTVTLDQPQGAGDQTVPLKSAEHQLLSGKFKGIFRQTGYEHQSSYQDENAIASTLYSLLRIALTMEWSRK